MYASDYRHRLIGLALSTALAGGVLAGCTSAQGSTDLAVAAPAAQADTARIALAERNATVAKAESAVLADPQAATQRARLGAAYLDAGRFVSAAGAFEDAMALGDESPRTALSLALALTASNRHAEAVQILREYQNVIAHSDLGLAMALAGQPQRGVHIISNAIRGGDNSVKARQNLAYTYALAGQWREARLMASQDIPADQVGARLEQWAQTVHPAAYEVRVAKLLGTPTGVADSGQPAQLALGGSPVAPAPVMAQVDTAPAPAVGELPPLSEEYAFAEPTVEAPVATPAPRVAAAVQAIATPAQPAATQSVAQAFTDVAPTAPAAVAAPVVATPAAPVVTDSARFQPRPVAAPRLATAVAPAPAKAAPAAVAAQGTHLVQLGSFSSEAGAKRAWSIYVKRYPELAQRDMVISEAVVRGKRYWRVSAGGYSARSADAMCSTVKSGGKGCFAYAQSRPLPGAVARDTQLARR